MPDFIGYFFGTIRHQGIVISQNPNPVLGKVGDPIKYICRKSNISIIYCSRNSTSAFSQPNFIQAVLAGIGLHMHVLACPELSSNLIKTRTNLFGSIPGWYKNP
jgi:hypothetical protein